jgi:ribonuclease-3
MTPTTSIETVQRILGYRFHQPRLLEEALTHKSYSNERRSKDRRQNERLEFLGDAVLSLVMSEYLAAEFPDSSEGGLSKLKAQLVSEASLARAARRMKLGRLLRLGKGEELSKGREKHSLLADALEALIAAVYLDGGLGASRTFTLRVLEEELLATHAEQAHPGMDDYKTQLQEVCQKRFETLPRYQTVRESGPDHEKVFEVELTIQGIMRGVGSGHSKKEAEQKAAKKALEQLIGKGEG